MSESAHNDPLLEVPSTKISILTNAGQGACESGMNGLTLGLLLTAAFLDVTSFGIVFPALPFFAQELQISDEWFGFVVACFAMGQLVGGFVLGRISDITGRRFVILFCLLGLALMTAALYFTNTLQLLCALRFGQGLFAGTGSTINACIADCTRGAERTKYMGYTGAAGAAGIILGPSVGGLLGALGFDFRWICVITAGIIACNFILALLLLPETMNRSNIQAAQSVPWSDLVYTATSRNQLVIFYGTFALNVALMVYDTIIAFVGEALFGMTQLQFSIILVSYGVPAVIVQGICVDWLQKSLGEKHMGVIGATLMGLNLGSITFLPSYMLWIANTVAAGVFCGMYEPAVSGLLSVSTPEDRQGFIMGIQSGISGLGMCIGPVLMSYLYSIDMHLPFLFSGSLMVSFGFALLLIQTPDGCNAPKDPSAKDAFTSAHAIPGQHSPLQSACDFDSPASEL